MTPTPRHGARRRVRLGVRGSLFVTSLLLIGTVGVISAFFLEGKLRSWLTDQVAAELGRQAHAAASTLELSNTARSDADRIADQLGAAFEHRVTVIDSAGVVAGDSALTPAELQRLDNHASRPEVAAALNGQQRSAQRFSTTLEADMLYVAVPFEAPDFRGVVRLAVTLEHVDTLAVTLRLMLLITGLVGLFASVLLGAFASHLASRRIRAVLPMPDNVEPTRSGSLSQLARELERTLEELRTERTRFSTVLESMGEALLALDSELRITLLNPAAVTLLDLKPDDVGRDLVAVNRTPGLNELARSGCTEPATAEFELPGPARRRVLARATPMHGTGGAVVVLHDVTEMRRLERVRRDFVANVSHELRTPVAIIRANAETLMDGGIDDAKRGPMFVKAIYRNSERLAQLIADILDLSRIEAGSYRLALDPQRVSDAVNRNADEVDPFAQERQITITTTVPNDLFVRADRKALDQILLNLIHNAVKYTTEGGHVTIGASRVADGICIEVRDDGPGIAAHHRARIFERFYRVDAGRARDVGGTGLGLAIVKHLVESMNGVVGVEAAEPHGSIFHLTLPDAREVGHTAEGSSPTAEGAHDASV